jgi:hypothetical protein
VRGGLGAPSRCSGAVRHEVVRDSALGYEGLPVVARGRADSTGRCWLGRRDGRVDAHLSADIACRVASSVAQAVCVDRCRRRRRPCCAGRPAIEKSGSRRCLGSQRRASCPARASICSEAVSSTASHRQRRIQPAHPGRLHQHNTASRRHHTRPARLCLHTRYSPIRVTPTVLLAQRDRGLDDPDSR